MPHNQRGLDYAFVGLMVALQIAMIILYAIFYRHALPGDKEKAEEISKNFELYPYFSDLHIMIFIGFGFMMSSFQKGRLHFIAICFWVGALSLQLYFLISIIFVSISAGEIKTLSMNMKNLIGAEGCAAALLIALCCIIGKGNNLQYLIVTVAGVFLFCVNGLLVTDSKYLNCRDVGGSMVVHTFATFYGMGLTWMLNYPNSKNRANLYANQNSYVTGMLGTLFFWCYWPSSNSALAANLVERQMAIVNTYFALIGSCIASYLTSIIVYTGKFDMDHILAGSIAGGVIIGTGADILHDGYIAFIVGLVSGALTCLLIRYTPGFLKRIGTHDVGGVFNLHGVPGILGGLLGAVFRAVYIDDKGLNQFLGTLVSLGIGLIGGVIVGLAIKGCHYELDRNQYYNDLHHVAMDKYVTQDLVQFGPPGYVDPNPSPIDLVAKGIDSFVGEGEDNDGVYEDNPFLTSRENNNSPSMQPFKSSYNEANMDFQGQGRQRQQAKEFQPLRNNQGYGQTNSAFQNQPTYQVQAPSPYQMKQGYVVNPPQPTLQPVGQQNGQPLVPLLNLNRGPLTQNFRGGY